MKTALEVYQEYTKDMKGQPLDQANTLECMKDYAREIVDQLVSLGSKEDSYPDGLIYSSSSEACYDYEGINKFKKNID